MNEDRLLHAVTNGTEASLLDVLSAGTSVSALDQLRLILHAFSWRNRSAQPNLVSTRTIDYVFKWLEHVDFEDSDDEVVLATVLENAPDCVVWGVRSVKAIIRVYVRRRRFDVNTFTLDFPNSGESRLNLFRTLPSAHVEESARDGDWLSICALAASPNDALKAMQIETPAAFLAAVTARIEAAIADVPLSTSLSPEHIVACIAYGMQCLLYMEMDIALLRDFLEHDVMDDPWSLALSRRLLCQSLMMEQDGERTLANAYEQAAVVFGSIDALRCDLARLQGCIVAGKACLRMVDVMRVIDGSAELSRSSSLTAELHDVISSRGDISDIRAALLNIQIEADRRATQCVSYGRACVIRMLLEARVTYYLGLADVSMLDRGRGILMSVDVPCEGSSVSTKHVIAGLGDMWTTLMPYQANCYETLVCAQYLLSNDAALLSCIRGSEAALQLFCLSGTRISRIVFRDEDEPLITHLEERAMLDAPGCE